MYNTLKRGIIIIIPAEIKTIFYKVSIRRTSDSHDTSSTKLVNETFKRYLVKKQ